MSGLWTETGPCNDSSGGVPCGSEDVGEIARQEPQAIWRASVTRAGGGRGAGLVQRPLPSAGATMTRGKTDNLPLSQATLANQKGLIARLIRFPTRTYRITYPADISCPFGFHQRPVGHTLVTPDHVSSPFARPLASLSVTIQSTLPACTNMCHNPPLAA